MRKETTVTQIMKTQATPILEPQAAPMIKPWYMEVLKLQNAMLVVVASTTNMLLTRQLHTYLDVLSSKRLFLLAIYALITYQAVLPVLFPFQTRVANFCGNYNGNLC